MSYSFFSHNKVAKITFILLLCAVLWFLYQHFYKPKELLRLANPSTYSGPHPASYAAAIKLAAPAVVRIQTTQGAQQQDGLGSGVIINTHGHILTNYHVIENTEQILVKLADGRSAIAEIIGSDPHTDLAVLQIHLDNLPTINMASSANLQVGDLVLAIGNPRGLNNSVTQGIISAIGPIKDIYSTPPKYGELLENLIQTDAVINLGNSGGALIDTNGNLIGINSAVLSDFDGTHGIGFAIPTDTIIQIAKQMITQGHIDRGWIGMQLSPISQETRLSLNYAANNGIYVQNVIRNSPAQKAGILPGDILSKIDNTETNELIPTIQMITKLAPEKKYNLEIFRQGKTLVFPVAIAERP